MEYYLDDIPTLIATRPFNLATEQEQPEQELHMSFSRPLKENSEFFTCPTFLKPNKTPLSLWMSSGDHDGFHWMLSTQIQERG
ncbi:hypothetical protein NPIL_606991 [Nephila pilipes]|uniref:Uncharacterized protein n=1 Tax=Nephila pilipes TaxID=299642 RepID=A0A8X6NNN7_NEPPI|nr:hypothetical protein NPIL_606991 [Nephila pilipes]